MKFIQMLAIALLLSACIPSFKLLKTGDAKMWDSYTVSTPEDINELRSDKAVLWTQDGNILESIEFWKPVVSGDKLPVAFFPVSNKDKAGSFRADMTPEEIVEVISDSLSLTQFSLSNISNLRPAQFGTKSGYLTDVRLALTDGSNFRGHVLFTVFDDKLWIIYYMTRRTHYYDARKPVFDSVIRSIQF